jgi:hypothetical protein
MQGILRGCAWALAIAAVTLAAGCEQARKPAASDLALATGALDAQLNRSATLIRANLREADADKRIYAQELDINGPSGEAPSDWWLYDKGFIKLAGVDSYHMGYFALTPRGQALVAGGDPRWLVSAFKGTPKVDCIGEGSVTTCTVTGTATVSLSPAGAALFDPVSLPPQSFTVTLAYYSATGWSVDKFEAAGGSNPSLAGQTALFGDRDAMFKAHYKWGEEVNKLVR